MPDGLKQWGNVGDAFYSSVSKAGQARLLRDWIDLGKYRHDFPIQRPKASKSLKNGLFELKTKNTADNLEYRCLYCFHLNEIVILLCFVKKTQKIDPSFLEAARRRQTELRQGGAIYGIAAIH